MPRTLTVNGFFARHGPLAASHPQYEFRRGQLDMALAVEDALAERRHLIVEAGTGTGKTLAYLVPALVSGKRIIVSTGTKNLQEQLYFKDIPFLREFFPDLKACYLKGRSNYACRQKIHDAGREPVLSGLDEVADFQIIREWEQHTGSGDRAEIEGLPPGSTAWAKLDARGELCSGQKCPQWERCFVTLARQRAWESDLIIVNHHLFFADLAVKEQDPAGGILPEASAVVFDEAHELEDIASQYFGLTVSSGQAEDLLRDIRATARRKEFLSLDLARLLETLSIHAERFFECFPAREGRSGFNRHREFVEENSVAYSNFLHGLDLLAAHLELVRQAPEELAPLHRRALELAARLREWMEGPSGDNVYWVERRGRGCYLRATPIDVSGLLKEKLFAGGPAAILTSATLAVAGGFGYTRARLGLDSARELIVPPHFDFRTQCLLYVPRHLPDVRAAGFAPAAAREVLLLLRHSRGRAFVLFTSYQQMRQVYELAGPDLGYPALLQGTRPTRALIEEFRRTPNCVLFATSSFWQGVDVQGDQLSCVIIDKLPFAAPSDPVVEARVRAIRDAGGDPFYGYQVPQAVIALKQGFGRLIRGRGERGVLALLDNRITRQRYGRVFFDSLPDYGFTDGIDGVEKFFANV